ncbi:helicase [Acinetobacter sp. ANC 4282]|uniref:helicase-related protein n=1 Tax=Acinetobacter terrae TaxID=2731247 RepID=UPI0014907DE4|nr:helicase-related protein [Acinetobacter terrae]NNH17074.1 helicase [Acinetobacter terrae]
MSRGAIVRDEIIFKTLQEELLGPCPYGEELDVLNSTLLTNPDVPYVTKNDKEEILKVYPIQRYGVGVIYPMGSDQDSMSVETSEIIIDEKTEDFDEGDIVSRKRQNLKKKSTYDDNNDFDISLANARAPSSIGLSFLLDSIQTDELVFNISGAFYKDFDIKYETKKGKILKDTWWYRKPIQVNFGKKVADLKSSFKYNLYDESDKPSEDFLKLFYVEGVVRQHKGKLLITVAVVNRHTEQDTESSSKFINRNRQSLFQTQLSINVPNLNKPAILPYPELINDSKDDLSNQLLYRKAPVFARGHGIACNWNKAAYTECNSVTEVFTEALPAFETPSISSDVEIENGIKLKITMEALANFTPDGDGDQQIRSMITAYNKWIQKNKDYIDKSELSNELKLTAKEHIKNCEEALARINAGYKLVCEYPEIQRAFKLANKAMLQQQKHAPKKIRPVNFDKDSGGHAFVATPFHENIHAQGIWRPFQIGFLLMCIQGAIDNAHPDHEKVDLIWFPTGGGKTEAYLGLAAFTLLFKRLQLGEKADGVQVLMRYTLRLLTAQQLQRAATLICCLEVIRQEEKIPGKRFSIGLWVGGKNTPNTKENAINDLKKLKRNVETGKEFNNPFLLDRCPYCASQMGIVNTNKNFKKTVVGYKADKQTNSVIFSCVDPTCVFHKQVPVFVIDEDIYEERPSVVIATVDKFAMLAWQPKIRSIFGINNDGNRFALPPQLIIQDELHLISGPLGSMVALYEPLIEEMCSDGSSKPKIVCATATTKGYQDQIEGIYGRKNVSIFPPAGVDAEDSFFARYARDQNGKLLPGRKYVGVCAPGLGSVLTTQVRTQSALLFAANRVEVEDRDPWVTLLAFYNSIRELGGAITLFQSDIVSYLLEQKRRYPRWLLPRRNVHERGMELTSRLKDDDIPKAIVALEEKLNNSELADSNFFHKLVAELKEIEKKHSEFKESISQLIQCIERDNKVSLENYYHFEKLYLGLKNKTPKAKLPENAKKFYDLCQNYKVQAFCLASSIIEVGVDIDRLSVMSIIGQPKTTAQYIQVSGRVGRRPDIPGLVVTIYNNSKPRDKSHYEDFRAYHQRLYAKVEPSTVTPFSRPALKRGLEAITVANVRQFSHIEAKPTNIDLSVIKQWTERFFNLRKHTMNDDEFDDITKMFNNFIKNWDRKKQTYNEWGQLIPDSEPKQTDLLYPLGSMGITKNKIPCPTSMRNVDAESSLWITDVYEHYQQDEGYFDE